METLKSVVLFFSLFVLITGMVISGRLLLFLIFSLLATISYIVGQETGLVVFFIAFLFILALAKNEKTYDSRIGRF